MTGTIVPGSEPPGIGAAALVRALERLDTPFAVADTPAGPVVVTGGTVRIDPREPAPAGALPLLAMVDALTPDGLGDPTFRRDHHVRVAYVAGAMANGIGSAEIVSALARAGMMGFFGAAGLPVTRIADAVGRLKEEIPGLPFGVNLIHSPQEPAQEQATVDLLLRQEVGLVEASAYLALTPMVVELRCRGLSTAPDGTIVPRVRIMAKVSRPEVAERFLRPPPPEIVQRLVAAGRLGAREAELAAHLPMCDDLTAEADSGGHTDNRPLVVLLPLLQALRDRVCVEERYRSPVRVGAAGGIGSPSAAAAAFTMGAAYVLTGSINQACVESGTSTLVRELLAEADMADVTMAPASDMFEAGVEVQVLRRGTLFPQRAQQLYELYRSFPSLASLPPDVTERLETKVFRRSIAEVWAECTTYFGERDPEQLARAARDPKHQMALVFRWYLGMSSRWAIAGTTDRKTDTQIWCGPAMGAFNTWTRGTFLAEPDERTVVTVAANLMAGAAFHLRTASLRLQGVDPGPAAATWTPRPLATSARPPAGRGLHAAP